MVENEQEHPLAPEAHRIAIHDNNASSLPSAEESKKKRNRKRCLQCCGCTTVVLAILGVIILVLMLTVFKVKDPKVNLNYVTIRGLESVNPLNLVPNTNLTLIADVSVKNPNAAAFKFKNATTSIYYEDVLIGEARNPQGNAKAQKTFRMKITMDFLLEKIVRVPRLLADLTAGTMPVSTQTNIKGRVEIINIIKKTVGVKLDCTLTVILANETVVDQKCKRYLAL